MVFVIFMKLAVLENFKFKSQFEWIEYIFEKTDNLIVDKIKVRLMNDSSMLENETIEEFDARKKERLSKAQDAPKKAKSILAFIRDIAGHDALEGLMGGHFLFAYEKDEELAELKSSKSQKKIYKNEGFTDFIQRIVHDEINRMVKQK